MSTIADRMDVMADAMEDIGHVDWAATLRELVAHVRLMQKENDLLYNRVEFTANTLRVYGPDGVTVLRTYTLDDQPQFPWDHVARVRP
jgi:hypothetical protein